MSFAVLVDITKCVGCDSCSVACKLYNNLEWDESQSGANNESGQGNSTNTAVESSWNNTRLKDNQWTTIQFSEHEVNGQSVWRFAKNQCLHCLEPACESACFAKAFRKTETGAVTYNANLCVGCRYCMLACPFDVPKFEWKSAIPAITKCQFCQTRITEGQMPACATACPTGALLFGDREELLSIARQRISEGNYVNHIYGENEVGGTSWLYISDVPFEDLGFRTDLPENPLPSYTSTYMTITPIVAAAWGGLLTGLYLYTKRRGKNEGKNE